MTPSPEFPYESRFVEVLGSRMHYVESGAGDPILFLHGNPTSSYLWRNVMPHLTGQGRTVAVDLIGMGKSDKPNIEYRFFDHLRYLEGFVGALGLENVTLVLHDWGGGVGLSYARRHPDNVRAIAFMEAVVKPMIWEEIGLLNRIVFKRMRDQKKGDRMNLRKNFFLKRLMPQMVVRKLTDQERAAYQEPYPTPQSRKPVAMWPREIPISGEPADMHAEISANYEWFQTVQIPKLLLYAEPGIIFDAANATEIKDRVEGLDDVFIGKGKHYLQEDAPDAIGQAISSWMRQHASA